MQEASYLTTIPPMPMPSLFYPFYEYWPIYAVFIVLVLCVLCLDLGVFHKKSHIMGWKESASWSLFWLSLAFVFNYALYQYSLYRFGQKVDLGVFTNIDPRLEAKRLSLEFLTGFIVEKALSVDNIFVFIIIFNLLQIDLKYQHRILFYGILGAFVFRGIFIAIGSVLMQYQALVVLFGIFLFLLGLKSLFVKTKRARTQDSLIFRFLNRYFRLKLDAKPDHFLVKHKNKTYLTPACVALIMIESADIVFAVDSIPAIFAITKEPLIVFTSNIFAMLGLRALYFLLIPMLEHFSYLKYGLGIILMFIGLKMMVLNQAFGGHFPIAWSLGFILAVLVLCFLLSYLFPLNPKNKHSLSA